MSLYAVEVVDPTGKKLADFSGRTIQLKIIASRNEAEDIYWRIDLDELENYCRLTNQDPLILLKENSSELRIRRGDVYLVGGQIVWSNPHIDADQRYYEVRAEGFLNLFAHRMTGTTPAGTVQEAFVTTEKTLIARTLITQSQALINGDFGVTVGPAQATVGPDTKNYSRTYIKDAIQDFGNLPTGSFDHRFMYDKAFNTYAPLGSIRKDVVFDYPGNIKYFDAPKDGTKTANEITALGSGFGADAAVVVYATDSSSQLDYKLRQNKAQANGTDNTDGGVTDVANTELAKYNRPFQIPVPVLDGSRGPAVGRDYWVGDWVKLQMNNYRSLATLNGLYRVEKLDIRLDEEEKEEVRPYVSQ